MGVLSSYPRSRGTPASRTKSSHGLKKTVSVGAKPSPAGAPVHSSARISNRGGEIPSTRGLHGLRRSEARGAPDGNGRTVSEGTGWGFPCIPEAADGRQLIVRSAAGLLHSAGGRVTFMPAKLGDVFRERRRCEAGETPEADRRKGRKNGREQPGCSRNGAALGGTRLFEHLSEIMGLFPAASEAAAGELAGRMLTGRLRREVAERRSADCRAKNPPNGALRPPGRNL